ncbi:MAG: hypothetical protein ABJA80_14165 [bacterium]
MDDVSLDVRNAGVVDFLRYRLTSDEQQWPRLAPRFRPVGEVPIDELRVHPDLIDRLVMLDAPMGRRHLRMLMGAAVLVVDSGAIYALAYSQHFLAVRLPAGARDVLPHGPRRAEADSAAEDPGRQPDARVALLGAGWTVADAWKSASLASLQLAVGAARTAVEGLAPDA